MKKIFTLAAAAAMSVGLVFAAPKAEWIPAKANLYGVVLRAPEAQAAAVENVWKAEAEKIGLETDEDNPALALTAIPEAFRPLAKALGCKKNLSEIRITSLTYGLLADYRSSPSAEDNPLGFITLECPTLNLPALDKAVKDDIIDDNGTVKRNGEWRVIRRNDTATDYILAYRPITGGIQLIIAQYEEVLDEIRAGKIPMAKASDTAIAKLFALPKNCASTGSAMLSNLSDIVSRALEQAGPEAAMQIRAMAPWVFDTRALGLKIAITDKHLTLALGAETKDEATAKTVIEQLIMLKGLLQMGVAQQAASGKFSAIAAAVSAITCKAKGKVARLNLSLTPAQALAVAKELRDAAENTPDAPQGRIATPALPDDNKKTDSTMSDDDILKALNEQ